MTEEQVKRIAQRVADYLFINGAGQKAERLMLVSKFGRDYGGWCRQAVVDVVVREVASELGAEAPHTPTEAE